MEYPQARAATSSPTLSPPARRPTAGRERGDAAAAPAPRTVRPWLGAGGVELLVVAILALGVRLVQLGHTPYIDELNHVLAARSWLEEGTFRIGEGSEYMRSWVFTYVVAGFVRFLGETLDAARLPAVLAGTALVVAVFVWVREQSNRWGAWTAALLLTFAPISIYLSQQVRFYTLQTLCFWLGAVGVYALLVQTDRRRVHRAALAAAVAVLFGLAFHLQPVSAVGMMAVAVWVALVNAPALTGWLGGDRRRWAIAAGTAVAVAVGVGVLAASGMYARAATAFGYADAWAAWHVDDVRFYHAILLEQYVTLWTLLPLLLAIAATRFTRPLGFVALVFGVAFVFHSLAAWKHERYLFYALPFLFASAGLAVAVAGPWLHRRVDRVLRERAGVGSAAARHALWAAFLVGAVGFAAAGNRATAYTVRMLTVADADWPMERAYRGEADWPMALPALRPAADDAEVVVSSAMLKSLFYLDRVDFGLTATEVARTWRGAEFAVAPKESVPVISTPESLERVRRCFASGLVIAERRSWRHDWGVTDRTADWAEASLQPVAVPPRSGILAFRWSGAADAAAECPPVPER